MLFLSCCCSLIWNSPATYSFSGQAAVVFDILLRNLLTSTCIAALLAGLLSTGKTDRGSKLHVLAASLSSGQVSSIMKWSFVAVFYEDLRS